MEELETTAAQLKMLNSVMGRAGDQQGAQLLSNSTSFVSPACRHTKRVWSGHQGN